jgi:hypothetical protein
MSRCPTFNFQLSIISKWLAKLISTNVSFKITIRKRHVYIDIGWTWIWKHFFSLGIRNDDLLKWEFCLNSSLVQDLIHRTKMKLFLLINSDTLICLWILVFPIRITVISTLHKCCFSLYFSSLHDYWPPSTWNSSVHTSLGKMVRCEKRDFLLLKMRKKKISWNLKTKCVTDFLLTVRSSSMKHYTCHYVVST